MVERHTTHFEHQQVLACHAMAQVVTRKPVPADARYDPRQSHVKFGMDKAGFSQSTSVSPLNIIPHCQSL